MNLSNIETQAEKLLNGLVPPIDIKSIAIQQGIIVSEAPSEDALSGLLFRNKKKKTIIGVNSFHSDNRKRFTIAHELGHYFLHQDDTFMDDDEDVVEYRHSSNQGDKKEVEANQFAAALLMPKNFLKKHFDSLREFHTDIDEIVLLLSEKYEVSKDAMRYRLMNLHLLDGIQ